MLSPFLKFNVDVTSSASTHSLTQFRVKENWELGTYSILSPVLSHFMDPAWTILANVPQSIYGLSHFIDEKTKELAKSYVAQSQDSIVFFDSKSRFQKSEALNSTFKSPSLPVLLPPDNRLLRA